MALEPSEVFCAAAMCFTEKALDDFTSETEDTSAIINLIVNFFPEAEEAAKNDVVFAENRAEFLRFFENPDDSKNTALVFDMVRGISAAKAIKKWMKSTYKIQNPTADNVFMTGNVWPDEVAPLAISAHGFDAYNSSDLVIKPLNHPNSYFGISLKKKPRANDQDPTLINKAFDTIMQGKEFDDVKKKLEKVREKYFAGLVKEAVKLGYIRLDVKGKSDKELYKPSKTVREKNGFMRPYIDTKGSLMMKEIGLDPKNPREKGWDGYGDKKLNRSSLARRKNETTRGWVNTQLSKETSIYRQFMKVMNDNSDLFAKNLINLTLKTDLPKLMKAKKLGKMSFGFALVTGIGGGTGGKRLFERGGKIVMEKGKAFDIHTILCGLADMDSDPRPYKFKIIKKNESDDNLTEGGAAKVYFDLIKANKTLMNMELRYKGGFTSQPQFFGTIADDFKMLLEKKCIFQGKDGKR